VAGWTTTAQSGVATASGDFFAVLDIERQILLKACKERNDAREFFLRSSFVAMSRWKTIGARFSSGRWLNDLNV